MKQYFALLVSAFCLFSGITRAEVFDVLCKIKQETIILDSVIVTNSTTKETVMLKANDILRLNALNGINDYNKDLNTIRVVNGLNGTNCKFGFVLTQSETCSINLTDMKGRSYELFHQFLTEGEHWFEFDELPKGVYVLAVNSNNCHYSAKIIQSASTNDLATINIKQTSTASRNLQNRSMKVQSDAAIKSMSFSKGDNLQFVAYSGTMSVTITDSPTESKTEWFDFESEIKQKTTTVEISKLLAVTINSIGCQLRLLKNSDKQIMQTGVCWSSINQTPTIADSVVSDTSGKKTFSVVLKQLQPDSTYFLRSFVTTSAGTYYGKCIKVRTIKKTTEVSVSFVSKPTLDDTAAYCTCKVTTDKLSDVIEYGICWSTNQGPTIRSYHSVEIVKNAIFSTKTVGWIKNVTYYIRAYARTKYNVYYSSEETCSISNTSAKNYVTDYEGNSYEYITIGSQQWLKENLRAKKFSNGDDIPTTPNSVTYVKNAIYQWPCNNDESLVPLYGRLYTWYVAADSRNVCPQNWHVPTSTEYGVLIKALGGGSKAGGAMKEAGTEHWKDPNEADNSSGLSFLPAGSRMGANEFSGFSTNAYIWTSSKYDEYNGAFRSLYNTSTYTDGNMSGYSQGYTIRCVKNIKAKSAPTVSTLNIRDIANLRATVDCYVSNNGGDTVFERGVCWNTSKTPTINNNKIISKSDTGRYSVTISALVGGLTYYVRSYAINEFGIAYGEEKSFSIAKEKPTIGDPEIVFLTSTQAHCKSSYNNEIGGTILEHGFCLSTQSKPSLTDKKFKWTSTVLNDVIIRNLQPETHYFVRSYSINSIDTVYSNDVSFTTLPSAADTVITDIDGNHYYFVEIGTQTWMAENLRVTHLNDGTAIPYSNSISSSEQTWTFYGNDSISNGYKYGALYNKSVVATEKICPTGWHVPSQDEWTKLMDYLTNSSYAYTKNTPFKTLASSAGWINNSYTRPTINDVAIVGDFHFDLLNISGFNALPAGEASYSREICTKWWTNSSIFYLGGNSEYYNFSDYISSTAGLSIRCIKNK